MSAIEKVSTSDINTRAGIAGALRYQRVAIKTLDGHAGYLYNHSWGTGYQQVIFSSHDSAEKFAANEGLEYVAPLTKKETVA